MVTAGPSPRPRDAPAWPKHRPRGARGNRLRHGGFFSWAVQRTRSFSYALYVWYIYLQNWVILFGQMLVNIPAPWSMWVWTSSGNFRQFLDFLGNVTTWTQYSVYYTTRFARGKKWEFPDDVMFGDFDDYPWHVDGNQWYLYLKTPVFGPISLKWYVKRGLRGWFL